MKTPIIKQPPPPAEEIPVEVIATAIVQIADAMQAINKSRLTRKAIVVLIHDQSKVAKATINVILNNLETLKRDWLKL